MLTYNDLTDICDKKRMTITEVADFSGMTLSGFRNAMRKSALTADKIILVCKKVEITPNQFFGVEETSGDTNYGNMQKNAKKQIMQVAGTEELKKTISILEGQLKTKDEQLKSKDEQLAAKDVQINKLLGI